MDLVPIKVKIGTGSNGWAKYPDFNSLSVVQQSGMDWSHYIDTYGTRWLYDCCGHKEVEAGSPLGTQWGMLLIPDVFATEAISKFPGEVTRLTESECQDFYDTKHARNYSAVSLTNQAWRKTWASYRAKMEIKILP